MGSNEDYYFYSGGTFLQRLKQDIIIDHSLGSYLPVATIADTTHMLISIPGLSIGVAKENISTDKANTSCKYFWCDFHIIRGRCVKSLHWNV